MGAAGEAGKLGEASSLFCPPKQAKGVFGKTLATAYCVYVKVLQEDEDDCWMASPFLRVSMGPIYQPRDADGSKILNLFWLRCKG